VGLGNGQGGDMHGRKSRATKMCEALPVAVQLSFFDKPIGQKNWHLGDAIFRMASTGL